MFRAYRVALLVPAVLALLNFVALLAFGADAGPCPGPDYGC